MAMISCPECGKAISDKAAACPSCGTPIAGVASPATTPSIAPNKPRQEEVLFDQGGVQVTTARAMLAGTTYSVANLTSVSVRRTVPPKGGPIKTIIFGLLIAAVGFKVHAGVAIVGVLIAAAGIAWILSLKDTFHVVLGTAGGETQGLSAYDGQFVTGVAAALNEAIVRRG